MDYTPLLIPCIIPNITEDFLFIDLYSLTSNYNNTINWLRDHGLLARAMLCKCGAEMYEGNYANSQDGSKWKCRVCKSSCSIRLGSFFHPSKLPLTSLLQFVYLWCEDIQLHAILEKQLKWAPATVVDWKNFMRDICIEEIIEDAEPLGGPGIIVEIDESKFGKRKYNRGRMVEGTWVFGILERDSGKMVMLSVADRSAATLLPLIQHYVRDGSVIYSDQWAAYNILAHTPQYTHFTVNHSENFVDPTTGTHTQGIEGSWNIVKKRQRRGPTTNPGELLETHLAESCWRRRNKGNIFNNIVKGIRNLYPVV